jgi:hypothetical protein
MVKIERQKYRVFYKNLCMCTNIREFLGRSGGHGHPSPPLAPPMFITAQVLGVGRTIPRKVASENAICDINKQNKQLEIF